MKTISVIFAMIIIITGMSSCARVYIPSAANAPLLNKKGDIELGGHFGSNGSDIQFAHAIGDKVGIIASGSFNPGRGEKLHHYYGELGVGMYRSKAAIFRSEFFAGAGYGSSRGVNKWKIDGETISQTMDTRYLKYFLQNDIGIGSGIFDLGLSTRLAVVDMYFEETQINDLTRSLGLQVEPVFFLRAGLGRIKLSTQLGFARSLTKHNHSVQPVIANIGIHFKFNGRR